MHYTSTLFFCNIQCCLMQGEPGTRKSIGCRRHAALNAHNGTTARYEFPTFIQLDLLSLRLPSRKRKRLQQDFCRQMATVRRGVQDLAVTRTDECPRRSETAVISIPAASR